MVPRSCSSLGNAFASPLSIFSANWRCGSDKCDRSTGGNQGSSCGLSLGGLVEVDRDETLNGGS